jgi:RecJ-like exonuclease
MENYQLEEIIEKEGNIFLEKINGKEVYLISHFDTDGITSATIALKSLKRLDSRFSLKIFPRLEKEDILKFPRDKILLMMDLGSNFLEELTKLDNEIFIIDHHEIPKIIKKENLHIINPHLSKNEEISSSGLVYLFFKNLIKEYKDLAKLAILGMIGDSMEKSIDKLNHSIIQDGEIKRRRGLLIYPSTRPINIVLEYSSNFFIPGVTGNSQGVLELLRESGIKPVNGKYKSIVDLTDEEMSKIITSIMLRNPKFKNKEILGDIFLIKFYNRLEDAREISAMINACSRLDEVDVAIQFCMEISNIKKKAELTHAKYKQYLISALNYVYTTEKIEGDKFIIINAKEKIKETIIGTVASILSNSIVYEEGTIIVTMANYQDKIKISSRCVGENKKNLREFLSEVINKIGGEVGGHESAAGGIIKKDKEEEFINLLKKNLEIETIKINNKL